MFIGHDVDITIPIPHDPTLFVNYINNSYDCDCGFSISTNTMERMHHSTNSVGMMRLYSNDFIFKEHRKFLVRKHNLDRLGLP